MRARMPVLIGLSVLVAGAAVGPGLHSCCTRAGGFRERTRQRKPTLAAGPAQQHAAHGRGGSYLQRRRDHDQRSGRGNAVSSRPASSPVSTRT